MPRPCLERLCKPQPERGSRWRSPTAGAGAWHRPPAATRPGVPRPTSGHRQPTRARATETGWRQPPSSLCSRSWFPRLGSVGRSLGPATYGDPVGRVRKQEPASRPPVGRLQGKAARRGGGRSGRRWRGRAFALGRPPPTRKNRSEHPGQGGRAGCRGRCRGRDLGSARAGNIFDIDGPPKAVAIALSSTVSDEVREVPRGLLAPRPRPRRRAPEVDPAVDRQRRERADRLGHDLRERDRHTARGGSRLLPGEGGGAETRAEARHRRPARRRRAVVAGPIARRGAGAQVADLQRQRGERGAGAGGRRRRRRPAVGPISRHPQVRGGRSSPRRAGGSRRAGGRAGSPRCPVEKPQGAPMPAVTRDRRRKAAHGVDHVHRIPGWRNSGIGRRAALDAISLWRHRAMADLHRTIRGERRRASRSPPPAPGETGARQRQEPAAGGRDRRSARRRSGSRRRSRPRRRGAAGRPRRGPVRRLRRRRRPAGAACRFAVRLVPGRQVRGEPGDQRDEGEQPPASGWWSGAATSARHQPATPRTTLRITSAPNLRRT